MKKIIVYFHGFNSTPNSEKVERLRAAQPEAEVHAWQIDSNPAVALDDLDNKIRDLMMTSPLEGEPIQLIFIGTSLGAWYAEILGMYWGARRILVNPCIDPSESLKKYNVDQDDLDLYAKWGPILLKRYMKVSGNPELHISLDDEVIDFTSKKDELEELGATFYEKVRHRFDGPEWDKICKAL